MKLQEFLSRHSQVSLGTDKENETILNFFHSLPMPGRGLQLQYDRSPDFFAFLKFHSPYYFVFLLWDKNILQGVGTLIIRPGFINGVETYVGYLGDLRVKPGKRNAVNWRNFYADLIQTGQEVEEFHGIKYFETVVMDTNPIAQAALISTKRNAFSYHLLTPYQMVNIYGKKPWVKIESKYEVRLATVNDEESIRDFWMIHEIKKPFGQPALLNHALKNWNDFDYNKIVLAMDGKKIVGMTGLWNPRQAKKIIIKNYPILLKLLTASLRLRKASFPKMGEELRPLYLTLLNFNEPVVLSQMLAFILNLPMTKNFHTISLTGYEMIATKQGLSAYFHETLSMGLYQVYDNETPEIKINVLKSPPGFEMALV